MGVEKNGKHDHDAKTTGNQTGNGLAAFFIFKYIHIRIAVSAEAPFDESRTAVNFNFRCYGIVLVSSIGKIY